MPPVDLTALKGQMVQKVKETARNVILSRWSLEKQKSMSDDSDYGKHAISGLMGISSDQVIGNAVSRIGLTDDVTELQVIEASIGTMDLAPIETGVPSEWAPLVDGYYRSIILSIVVYRLIRVVRNWSNAKEDEIMSKTTADEVNSVDINDFPLI